MFTRRKHNRSGTISVVVVDKSGGGFKEIHRVGVAHSEEEAAALEAEGRHWIATYGGQQLIDFEGRADKELRTAEDVLSSITSTRLSAAQTIIGKVYDSIGFDEIEDEELRHLVIGRICQPMSKKATVDYLRRHFKDDVSLQKIYRYMDKLNNTQKDRVQEISVRHTQTLFGGNIGILFYDVTTLYFETTDKDELRNNGFSKDGKNANPQVVLGLLVSRGGYPLSYALFNGAQFEGYTMIPIVDDFIQRYNLGSDFVVIADSGLMSEKNVQLLRSAGYKYISFDTTPVSEASEEQKSYVEALRGNTEADAASTSGSDSAAPQKTVAIFSINSTRQVVTRGAGDYFGKMVEIAGGTLSTPATDTGRATQTVSMESFYAAAEQADILIYNASIEDAPEDLQQMCAKDSILTQFRAVREGNVWCMRSSLYQNASRTGAIIRDLHAIVAGEADEETEFFYRLK